MASIFDNATPVPTRGDAAPIVRDVYDALRNGSQFVVLLGKDASDDFAATLADTEEVIEGAAIVLRTPEYTAEDLRTKINRKNSDSKRHDKVTFGAVSVSNYQIEKTENGEVRVGINVSKA